jgi:uncharacterized damage-inducible protein DinB
MATKTQHQSDLATFLADRWQQSATKMEELVAALPEDKLEWTPVEGVRSYGGVLRHVAFWNRYVVDTLNGKQPDETSNELPAAEYATKKKVVEILRRTSQDVAGALRAQPASADRKTLELSVAFLEHNSEHYGQLVVYGRLIGVVPPASRG